MPVVVLMDDARDRQTVSSRAFEQLPLLRHDKIPVCQDGRIRYRNELHLAVAALARGEPTVAFEHIEKAGGQIIEIGARSRSIEDQKTALRERRDYIADHYANLTPDERAAIRILDLTNKGKRSPQRRDQGPIAENRRAQRSDAQGRGLDREGP